MRRHRRATGAGAAAGKRVQRLAHLFGDAVRRKLLPANPFDGLKTGSAVNHEREAYVPAETVARLYGLREARDPLLIIVIGQAALLPPHRLRVLRDLNLSLHRVAIVPYDVLVERATTILKNVADHLAAADQPDAAVAP